LARDKPEASMVPCGTLPSLPESLKARPGKDQANYILATWGEAVEVFADCRVKNLALIEWIRKE